MKYFCWSPTFSLVTTSPWFFVSEPPALSMARVVCFCQPIALIISASVVPPSRLSIAITWLLLLPSRGPPVSFVVAAAGAIIARLALVFAGSSCGATWSDCGATSVAGAASGPRAAPTARGGTSIAVAVSYSFVGCETGRILKMIKGTLYRRLERLEARVPPAHPETHTICFISVDQKVVSTFEMATSRWTHFDPPRDRAEFERIV